MKLSSRNGSAAHCYGEFYGVISRQWDFGTETRQKYGEIKINPLTNILDTQRSILYDPKSMPLCLSYTSGKRDSV